MPPLKEKKEEPSVLIVGAGPTGLTVACELARRGVGFRIIDKSSLPSDRSKALALNARTLELLNDLGIATDLIAEGLKAQTMQVFEGKARIIELNWHELESPFPFVLILPQSKTEQHLIRLLASFKRDVERGVELVGIEPQSDSVKITTKLADGNEHQQAYSWVVGCDGAASALRAKLAMPFDQEAAAEVFALCDADVEWPLTFRQQPMTFFSSEDGLLAVFQIKEQLHRIIAKLSAEGTLSNQKMPTLADIQKLVSKRGPKGMTISNPIWLSTFKVQPGQIQEYRHGRVLMAGDAAHTLSPAGGQGMNTGIQDAVNLSWKLALVVGEGADEKLMNTYCTERRAIAASLKNGSQFLSKVNIMQSPIGKELRKQMAPILIAQEVVQNKMRRSFSEMSIAYKESPIVFEHKQPLMHVAMSPRHSPDQPGIREWFEFGSGPLPGERAPDASAIDAKTGKSVRLFEACRGPRHSLLLLIGEQAPDTVLKQIAPLAHAVEQNYCRLVHSIIVSADGTAPEFARKLEAHLLLDVDLTIHHLYGGGTACAYLIRPDGYVGYRGQPPELSDIEKYFKQLLGI